MQVILHKFIAARGKGGVGKVAGIGKALAHLKYIMNRPGEDRERGGRELFNDQGDRLAARDVRRAIKDLGEAKVIVHKLALSPEVSPADKKGFTRDVMHNLSREKGLDLDWVAVAHNNTDHHHIHVVILGKDRNGTEVNLSLKDVEKAKEYSDRFIEKHHPREFERAREAREQKEREKDEAKTREKEERIREGLELPWMRKAIIREQLEPYKEWKQKKEQERSQGDKDRNEPKRSFPGKTIEAAGKEWSKANSLQELRELNEHLWENQGDRIPLDEYKKLVAWIHEKEEKAKYPNQERKAGGGGKAKQEERKRDHFEHNGEKYSSTDSYEKLTGLAKGLRENKEKLPINDYQNLRGWIEDKDRERWAGALGKQIEHDRYRFEYGKSASDLKAAEGGRVLDPIQQSLAGNPFMKLFMFEASLARMVVAAIPLTENRDHLKDSREELERAKNDLAQTRPPEGTDSKSKAAHERQEQQREAIDKAIERNEKAQDKREEERKRKQEEKERGREDRDSFERDSWGRY
jgi:hypothetical protein